MKNLRKVITQDEKKKVIDLTQLAGQKGLARATSAQDPAQAAEMSELKLTKAMKEEPAVRKVVKKAARLADMISDDDRQRAKDVIREAMEAVTRVYDHKSKSLDIQPDHKTRLAAATLQLAYDEGTPIKRSVTISTEFRSAEDILEAMRRSPEASRAMRALSGLGIPLEIEGEIINTMPETVKSDSDSTE